jgi:nucleoside-diphosphate-sugar epimerase
VKILVTGIDGYIGALLGPMLIESGHEVVGLDTGFYRRGWWYTPRRAPVTPVVISRDIRQVRSADLAGYDCVVHLAELSNDPLGALNPRVTMAINHAGSVGLAREAKAAGVRRFVYSSSCSVYGAGGSDWLAETSPLEPQTTYAVCKAMVERDIGAMADATFSPVFLRNATAYGASPRMRFDLVVNNLSGLACATGRIAMTSDGSPWRPLVHVLDICGAIVAAADAPIEAVHGEVFNVGRNDQNFQVRDIAARVSDAFPGCTLSVGAPSSDTRSYRVSFDKIQRELPGFACRWDLSRGIEQLRDVFARVGFTGDQFTWPPFTRIAELEYLLATRQVDADLFWTA